MPLLGDPDHEAMVQTLKEIADKVDKPSAILMISALEENGIQAMQDQ